MNIETANPISMTDVETATHATMAVAGFVITAKYVPNDLPVLGKYADLAFGLGVMSIGMYMKKSAIVAFGVGATLEGAMVALGLKL